MKPSEPVSAEKGAVNREPDINDLIRLREGRGPTFTEIAAVNRDPEVIDLKGLREARGLSLRDVFSVTRITITNLEAIEAGNYHLLPAPVYARTFIKTYAGLLETDSKPILQQYEYYLKSSEKSQDLREEDHKEQLPGQKGKKYHVRPLLWVAAAILLSGLMLAIVLLDVKDIADLLSFRPTSSQKTAPQPAPAPNIRPPATAETTPAAVTQPGQSPAVPGGGQKQVGVLNLKIEAVEKTWIRISADGEDPEQMMLEKGDRIERKAREAFLLDIGNAGGLLVSFQDKPLPSLGKRGEVIHLKLP